VDRLRRQPVRRLARDRAISLSLHLCDEVVPWVDGRYRTLAAAGHRAIMG
jgi:enterochelin esterase-like enzyme